MEKPTTPILTAALVRQQLDERQRVRELSLLVDDKFSAALRDVDTPLPTPFVVPLPNKPTASICAALEDCYKRRDFHATVAWRKDRLASLELSWTPLTTAEALPSAHEDSSSLDSNDDNEEEETKYHARESREARLRNRQARHEEAMAEGEAVIEGEVIDGPTAKVPGVFCSYYFSRAEDPARAACSRAATYTSRGSAFCDQHRCLTCPPDAKPHKMLNGTGRCNGCTYWRNTK